MQKTSEKRFNVITPKNAQYENQAKLIHYWQMVYQRGEKELIVDNFAGGGGASCGIEDATGNSVDVAINHDVTAISMHRVNHPNTIHYRDDVWNVHPKDIALGRPVGLVWLSPDCKHFSKAKGGKPVEKGIRGLAWVAVRWAATVHPRVIMLENVEEFQTWGPLIPKCDPDTGRMLKRIPSENSEDNDKIVVAEPGEIVPYDFRVFTPDPAQKGRTFRSFVNALRRQGYHVEWRELLACDYGAPTKRKRFFLVARCDGRPIVWPQPTHGAPQRSEVQNGVLEPWKTAASIIDWSIPAKSIFGRKKPLAVNTLRRIFRGLDKYIIQVAESGGTPFLAPYLIKVNHQGKQFRGQSLADPLQTITSKNGWGIVTPYIARIGQTGFGGDRLHYEMNKPLTTIITKAEHLMVCPTLIQVGYGERKGQAPRALDINKPVGTITAGGNKFAVAVTTLMEAARSIDPNASHMHAVEGEPTHADIVTSNLVKLRGTCKDGQAVTDPMPTITAGGLHIAEVRTFLAEYKETAEEPHLGIVEIQGVSYQIIDIGFRMLQAHELFAAQGFPPEYIIDADAEGVKYSQKDQVARCGNAVPPPFSKALVRSNLPHLCVGSGRTLSIQRYHAEAGQLAFSM